MNYHNITKTDMLNGDGLRVVLWVAGCSHQCKECHNPITWNVNGGLKFDSAAKQEIFEELEKSYVHGITFSGGDPLHIANIEEVTQLAKEIRETYPNKTIWLYTGSVWEEVKDFEIVQYLDVLVDGEFVAELKDESLHWVGSSNQRVIEVKETVKTGKIVLKKEVE